MTSQYQEDFILDQIERANLVAAVVLDNTPRSQWRVSSLQGKLFQPSLVQLVLGGGSVRPLPVLLVREDDWRPHQAVFSTSMSGSVPRTCYASNSMP